MKIFGIHELPNLFYYFVVAKTVGGMIVDQPRRLHKGIADSGTDKLETSFFQVFAHGIGFGRRGRNFTVALPAVDFRFPPHELPEVRIKGSELFPDI